MSNWMNTLNDEKFLHDLTIPGTHDSATYKAILWAKTQDRNLEEQLNDGIRFFDIRVHGQDSATLDIKLQHGMVQLDYISLRDVLNLFKSFLERNPREFILMSLKNDAGPENQLDPTIRMVQNEYPFYLDPKMPKVGQVRGRIVLFRRFSCNGELGLNIHNINDNNRTEFDNGFFKYEVQDFYNANSKDNNNWNIVEQQLQRCCYSSDPVLHLNFTSAVDMNSILDPIKCFANKISDHMPFFLQDTIPIWPHRYGIVLLDFYNPKIVTCLYNSNFKPTSPNFLQAEQILWTDQSLNSQSGYTAYMQSDGNFVIYHSGTPVWDTRSQGKGNAPFQFKLQNDGNIVIYDGSSQAIWASNTCGKGHAPYKLILQIDGNLVLYDRDKKPIWATATNKK